MAFTAANVDRETLSGLPAPIWSRMGIAPRTITTGETVPCDIYTAKVPLVDSDLLEQGKLFVQYGRISRRDSKGSPSGVHVRPMRIKWYTPYVGGVNPYPGSGEVGGTHVLAGGIDRPNLIPVTQQNETVAQEVPYWAFYATGDMEIFDADPNTLGWVTLPGVPFVTGNKRRAYAMNPSLWLPSGALYGKRPKFPKWKQRAQSVSYWFCRLAVIEDGLAIGYGPTSEALVVRPNEVPFGEFYMASLVRDFSGEPMPVGYALSEFKAEIVTKYRA
jgi:hypothetical protein